LKDRIAHGCRFRSAAAARERSRVIITIRPGFQVRVIVNRDLVFAAYQG